MRNLEKLHIKNKHQHQDQNSMEYDFKKYWVRIAAPQLKHLIKKDQRKATNKKGIVNILAETFS